MTNDSRQSQETLQLESVCFLTEPVGFGGAEIHTLGLIQNLVSIGHPVVLIQCRRHDYDEPLTRYGLADRLRLIHTDIEMGFGFGSLGYARSWKRQLNSIACDVLIVPKITHLIGRIWLLYICRRHFNRVFFIEHLESRLPPKPTHSKRHLGFIPGVGLWWYILRAMARIRPFLADRVIAVSCKVRQRLVEDWGYPPDKVITIHNGVSWQTFARNPERGAAFLSKEGVPHGARVFGMIARLVPNKGVDLALRALHIANIRDGEDRYWLLIAGDGPEEESLRQLAKELGVDHRVKFLGFLPDVRDALSAFDFVVFASRLEGLPLGLLEAMAAGCIPIVTRISGMPEVVDSEDIGWVVPPESVEELSEAMSRATALSAEKLIEMRTNVTQRVRECFDIEKTHREIRDVCGLSTSGPVKYCDEKQ